jgi:DNA-binding transcriptional regulator YiaG
MKSEVVRLARKEVRAEVEGLKKAAAHHRQEISELKRQIATLQKLVERVGRRAKGAAPASDAQTGETAKRFSAKGFATHREKLGLSAEEAGLLLGVSAQTVYGWEKGRKPQDRQMGAIAKFRKMGKREAKALLAEAAG